MLTCSRDCKLSVYRSLPLVFSAAYAFSKNLEKFGVDGEMDLLYSFAGLYWLGPSHRCSQLCGFLPWSAGTGFGQDLVLLTSQVKMQVVPVVCQLLQWPLLFHYYLKGKKKLAHPKECICL